MRILTVGSMYPPHHLGGYELVWQAAVRALRAAGHEVRVLASDLRLEGDRAEEDPDVHRVLRWYWRDHEFPPLGSDERLALERGNHAVFGRHLGELTPDVVSWWHMGGMSLSLVERVRRAGPPAIGWVNDDWLCYGPRVDQWLASGRRWFGFASREGVPARVELERAARWVFCSEVTRSAALSELPGLRDTAVLHQGVSPIFEPAAEREWEGRLLYVGRIDERKGIATVIEALALVPDVRLAVVGEGDPAALDRLRARAEALGVGERVSWQGGRPRADLPGVYAGSDAVVFPVEWVEPWGLVPLEAMAVGRPVLATGRGGNSEYLESGRNVVLFKAGDPQDLAAAIARVAADPALRGRLREGGFATAARLTEAAWTEAVVAEHERLGAGRAGS